MNKIFCKVCNTQTQYTIFHFNKYHLQKEHNINSKKYYDIYFKNKNEGTCLTCGKETKFKNIHDGYLKFCSNSCVCKNKKIKQEQTKTRINNEKNMYGVCKLQTDEFKNNVKKTKKEKYDDENYCNVNQIKNACIQKYGVSNFSKTKQFRKIMENKKLFIPLDKKSDFEKYRLQVKNETRKWKKELFNNWDGNDYYTGEKLLIDSKKYNNPLYRTIDHKFSIYNGFINNISSHEIGHLNNLCITSKRNNSIKKHKNNI